MMDVPLSTQERVMLPMAIQFPAAACETMEESPGNIIAKCWKLEPSPEIGGDKKM
jgi:hypothetical protein